MDEIDAALDFRNVSIVANYIKDRTKNAQFIIISLRNDMFELSHRLIGIYKTSNQTKSKVFSVEFRTVLTVCRYQVFRSIIVLYMRLPQRVPPRNNLYTPRVLLSTLFSPH